MISHILTRLILCLFFTFLFSSSVSFADHENETNQPTQDNSTLPDFDDMETLPDLDELSPLEDAPAIEKNIPEQQPQAPEIKIKKPDLSKFNKGGSPNLVLIVKGEVVKISNGKLLIQMRSGYHPNIGDKVKFNSLHPNNAETQVGSGVIIESEKEVWALISSGAPGLGMSAVITSTNPRKNSSYVPEKLPVAMAPSEPDINATAEDLYRAGGRFFRGMDGPQDYEKAFRWIKLAADKGHSQAQNDVGVMYETGQGVNQDPVQAMYWFQKSAAGNYPLAHYNLGRAYDSGMGGRKNYSEAIKSYRRAAKLGEPKAQKRLRKQRLRW
ncbi:MAG: tetratricopeptide repeat protein [Nitrospinales bacterium]